MTEKVTTQLEQVYKKGRTAKNLIPHSLIPDLGWNTDQQGPKKANTTKRKTTRGRCNPNYAYTGGGTSKQ